MKHGSIAGLALAAAAWSASAAMAAVPTVYLLDLPEDSGWFGNSFAANNPDFTFVDHFRFTVAQPGMNFDAIVSSIARRPGAGVDITGVALYYDLDGPGPMPADTSLTAVGRGVQYGNADVWTLHTTPLWDGDFELAVSGTVTSSTAGASYAGAAMLAPTPEPYAWALMTAGLGVLEALRRLARRLRYAAS
jgi:hypothetical protein